MLSCSIKCLYRYFIVTLTTLEKLSSRLLLGKHAALEAPIRNEPPPGGVSKNHAHSQHWPPNQGHAVTLGCPNLGRPLSPGRLRVT